MTDRETKVRLARLATAKVRRLRSTIGEIMQSNETFAEDAEGKLEKPQRAAATLDAVRTMLANGMCDINSVHWPENGEVPTFHEALAAADRVLRLLQGRTTLLTLPARDQIAAAIRKEW